MYSNGSVHDLGALPAGNAYALASDVNDSGQVAGSSAVNGLNWHAVVYGGGCVRDIGTLVGGGATFALGINNNGQVVGKGYVGDRVHAFLYTATGDMQDLGTLPGTSDSFACAVNDLGQVVGDSGRAFVYSGSGPMQDLNSLIASSSGWTLTRAVDINNKGQIVGSGTNPAGQERAFLLSPIFTAYKQSDPGWADNQYANSSYTIKDLGCALSSLAMAITGAGIAQDPGLLNSLLTAKGGYSKDAGVDWGTAVREAANAAGKPKLEFIGKRKSSTADLDDLLSHGYPVIVGVNYSAAQNAWTHFVVVTGKQGNTYTIVDPDTTKTTLAQYNNQFETRGYVVDPIDVSEINISVVSPGSGVNLLLTDFHGNKTGIDGSGGRFELIPNSVHFIDAITNLASGESPNVSQLIHVSYPESGNYGIEIRGIDALPSSYYLIETAFAPDGSQLWRHEISGVVAAGSVDQYSITYVVAEPSTFALLGAGAIGLLAYAWRRRRS